MFIRRISVKRFRHIHDVNFGPFSIPPNGSDVIALAGPNGGGKSSILELIGYVLSQSWSLSWSLSRSFSEHSFEAEVGLTSAELELVKAFAHEQPNTPAEALSHVETHRSYMRGFNFQDGEYAGNANLFNQAHNLVAAALRNHYQRSIGFFLKSDRSYPRKGFERNKIFDYQSTRQQNHIWKMCFNTSDVQYQDMFDFLVQQRFHYFRELGSHHHRIAEGDGATGEIPTDPLKPYDKLLQQLFPDYRFTDKSQDVPDNLYVELPDRTVIQFNDLSSGEKEVFFILSFFLRHDVKNAVLVVDEPELHLHPELGRLLIRTMQSIRPGNQIWVATHNAEIVEEAGRDSVYYISRDPVSRRATVTTGTDEDETARRLREMFGHSGYVGVGRSMVFLEGRDASCDRKMFSRLFPDAKHGIKFVPCQSATDLTRMNAAILSILEANVGWMRFYLIRDRDYLPQATVSKYENHSSGRLHVLKRYHIENYLINDELIARVQKDIFGKDANASNVRASLQQIAVNLAGDTLRDMLAFRLNLLYQAEDFSLGKFMSGERLLDIGGDWNTKKVERLATQLREKVRVVHSEVGQRTSEEAVSQLIDECKEAVHAAVRGEEQAWRYLMPGRTILQEYAKRHGLGKPPAFTNSLIKELASTPELVDSELRELVQRISSDTER